MNIIHTQNITDENDPIELKNTYYDYHRFHYVIDESNKKHLAGIRKYSNSVKFFTFVDNLNIPVRKTLKKQERDKKEFIEQNQILMF